MYSLVLKDLYILKKYLSFAWIFLIISALQPEIIPVLSIVFLTVFSISSFSYDELAKWDKYANVLPMTRKQIVGAKYIFFIGTIILVFMVSILFIFIFNLVNPTADLKEILDIFPFIFFITTLLLAVLYPVTFKFGVQKSRYIMFILAFTPGTLVSYLGEKQLLPAIPSEKTFQWMIYASPFIAGIFLVVSFLISVKIYEKKEF